MTGSSTPNPAPNPTLKRESYSDQFPALPPRSQLLPIAPGFKVGSIEYELMTIINGPSTPVQLVRPVCPSPTNIRNRVVGVITGTGWNPPISLDRAKWKDAYNAYKRANDEFDTKGKLGEYPPLMNYPHVQCPPTHH
jgi:hypothetical protein